MTSPALLAALPLAVILGGMVILGRSAAQHHLTEAPEQRPVRQPLASLGPRFLV